LSGVSVLVIHTAYPIVSIANYQCSRGLSAPKAPYETVEHRVWAVWTGFEFGVILTGQHERVINALYDFDQIVFGG